MKLLDILRQEHRLIERGLSILDRLANRAEARKELDAAIVQQLVDFFRQFADECHHYKEEHVLFPEMERHGFSPVAGPTAVMRYEHEEGRKHIRAMLRSAQHGDDPESVARFVHHARCYSRLLRNHIAKEEQCLFSMAEHSLPAKAASSLDAVVAQLSGSHGDQERAQALARDLLDRLEASLAANPQRHTPPL